MIPRSTNEQSFNNESYKCGNRGLLQEKAEGLKCKLRNVKVTSSHYQLSVSNAIMASTVLLFDLDVSEVYLYLDCILNS
jgi:hypothetical protein